MYRVLINKYRYINRPAPEAITNIFFCRIDTLAADSLHYTTFSFVVVITKSGTTRTQTFPGLVLNFTIATHHIYSRGNRPSNDYYNVLTVARNISNIFSVCTSLISTSFLYGQATRHSIPDHRRFGYDYRGNIIVHDDWS